MQDRRPAVGITLGDPAGIGPEVVLRALEDARVREAALPIVYGSPAILRDTAARLGSRIEITVSAKPIAGLGIAAVRPDNGTGKIRPGRRDPVGARASWKWVDQAVKSAIAGEIDAIATAPVDKGAINESGIPFTGHTEFIAEQTGARRPVMMLAGGGLRVAVATTHVAIRDVPGLLKKEDLVEQLCVIFAALSDDFGLKRARIAVCGLNPHAGERGHFGDEESRVIAPAVSEAKAMGVEAEGPFAGDTIFSRALRGEFDAVLAMYHDQGLAPLKAVSFGRAINVTLGLPIVRTSVDHGVAYDLAGTGKADCESMVEAILVASEIAERRRKKKG